MVRDRRCRLIGADRPPPILITMRALSNGDLTMARDAANKLAGQVADLVGHGHVDDQLATQLQADADRLVTAANAVPMQR
jgi:hypothetical protein